MYRIVITSLLVFAGVPPQADTIWGGDHIEIQITGKRATVEFDCAHGTIDGALAPDATGRFEVAGTFTPESAGPVRGDAPPALAATYAGTIKEDAMTLRVTIKGQDAPPPMAFELVRGRAGRVRKCR